MAYANFSALYPRTALPEIHRVDPADLREVLLKGLDDFSAKPSHILLLVVLYPILGLIFARAAAGYDLLPLVFPLVSGFALVGPLAALGLYELSRRRELGMELDWGDALHVVSSPSIMSIIGLSIVLGIIYFAWLGTAQAIYWAIFGNTVPDTVGEFVRQVLTTRSGWTMIIVGWAVGFVFALIVLAIASVSFPMLLDRPVSAFTAVRTSVAVFIANPITMIMWGVIVASLLFIGSVPLFLGLAVVMPVLGHATWHLYRKAVPR